MARSLTIGVALAFVAAGVFAAEPRVAPRPGLFPLAKGGKWQYRRTYGGRALDLVVGVGDVVRRDGRAEAKFTGDFEYLGFEERMTSSAGALAYRPTEGRGDVPPVLIRRAVEAGDRWDSLLPIGCGGFAKAKATVGGREKVVVPAGTFDAVKVTYAATVFGGGRTMPVWYAEGVGVVKQVYCPESSNIVIELVKHTPGE